MHQFHLKSNKLDNHSSCLIHKSLNLCNLRIFCTNLVASSILRMSQHKVESSSLLPGHSRTLAIHNGLRMYSYWRHRRTTLLMIDGLQRWTWSQDSRLPSSSTSRPQFSQVFWTLLSHWCMGNNRSLEKQLLWMLQYLHENKSKFILQLQIKFQINPSLKLLRRKKIKAKSLQSRWRRISQIYLLLVKTQFRKLHTHKKWIRDSMKPVLKKIYKTCKKWDFLIMKTI